MDKCWQAIHPLGLFGNWKKLSGNSFFDLFFPSFCFSTFLHCKLANDDKNKEAICQHIPSHNIFVYKNKESPECPNKGSFSLFKDQKVEGNALVNSCSGKCGKTALEITGKYMRLLQMFSIRGCTSNSPVLCFNFFLI